MKKKIKRIALLNYIIIGILLVAFLFRFYRLSSWVFFGMDQEYEALIIKNIIAGKHFPAIGVNAGDTGIYLGPFFIYFAAIVYALFSGNPIGLAIVASFFGVFVTYIVYKVAKEMFSERVAIFSSFVYAGSFLTSFYDRQFWNPTLVPLLSLLIGYFLYKILEGRNKYLVFLAGTFSIAIQCHLSMLVFLPFIFYVLLLKRKRIKRRIFIVSLVIFFILQSPIIFFDIRHNFLNTKAAVRLVTGQNQNNGNKISLMERNGLFLSSLGRFYWTPPVADLFLESGQCKELAWLKRNAYPEGIVITGAGIVLFLWWCFHKKKRGRLFSFHLKLTNSATVLLWMLILVVLAVQIYNRFAFEYYLLFFFPWLAIILGRSLDFIWKKNHGAVIVLPILFSFLVLNLVTLFTSFFSYSYNDKIEAIKFTKQYISYNKYSLEALGECARFGGYRYLFERFARAPRSSYMDSYFSWLYPDEIDKIEKSSRIVLLSLIDPRADKSLIAKWEDKKLRFLTNYTLITKKIFGQIKVYIFDSKSHES